MANRPEGFRHVAQRPVHVHHRRRRKGCGPSLAVVHLLFGVVGIAVSSRARASRTYLLAGGVIYLLLLVYGLVLGGHSGDVVPVNSADNWLHAALGVVMIGAGYALPTWTDRTDTRVGDARR